VKFVAADPLTGDVSVAAQIAAQTLGPEFKDWLNDPQKLLQLIAASEGANRGGGGSAPAWHLVRSYGFWWDRWKRRRRDRRRSVASDRPGRRFRGRQRWPGGGSFVAGLAGATGAAGTATATAIAYGNTVPLQEEEVVQAIRLLTQFGEASKTSNPKSTLCNRKLRLLAQRAPEFTGLALQSCGNVGNQETDSNMLMKAAEHMAIKFALESTRRRHSRERRPPDAGTHEPANGTAAPDSAPAGRQDGQGRNPRRVACRHHGPHFWAEVPDSGKRSVLLSNEAACVPARNIKQFLDTLIERGDAEGAIRFCATTWAA